MSNTAENIFANSTSKVEMEKILTKLEGLPTLPNIVYELDRIINNPMSSAADVSKIMERDQSLAAKVLKLVNSAYFGIPGGIADLKRAISYLGYDAVNQLVLTATVFKTLNISANAQFKLGDFWKHAVGAAMTAETLAKWNKFHSPSDCFSSALMHDLGKVALYNIAPEFLDLICKTAKENNISVLEAEIKMNAVTHSHLGSMLATLWKLPAVVEASILYHHEPDIKKRNILKPDINYVVDIVFLSNALMHQLQFGDSGHNQRIEIGAPLLKRLQINAAQLPLMLKDVVRTLQTADDFIKVIAG